MEKYSEILRGNPLFQGIPQEEYEGVLKCLNVYERTFGKNEFILIAGNPVLSIGIVVKGDAKIIKENVDGDEFILSEITSSEMFGEVFACAGVESSPVSVVATSKCQVLFLDFKKIITTCSKTCSAHKHLTENMLYIIAKKNLLLNQKIDIISKKSLREKIWCYFTYVSKGSKEFVIPFNREELASYLCADRSALSAELSRMQKENLIQFRKNQFVILQ